MSNKRRIIGNVLLVTGLLLLLGAGGLYFYNMIESNRQAEDSLEIVSRVKTEISAAVTDIDIILSLNTAEGHDLFGSGMCFEPVQHLLFGRKR